MNTSVPPQPSVAGLLLKKVVELDNGRGLLLYPQEGEPISIPVDHGMYQLILGAHKKGSELSAEQTPSLWSRLKAIVSRVWTVMKQPITLGRSSEKTIAQPYTGNIHQAPGKDVGQNRNLTAQQNLGEPIRPVPSQEKSTGQERGNQSPAISAHSRGEPTQEKEQAIEKPQAPTKKTRVLFNEIVWDKEKGFTATLGNGKRVEIGKTGPAADQFHAMMTGLATMIKEVHATKQNIADWVAIETENDRKAYGQTQTMEAVMPKVVEPKQSKEVTGEVVEVAAPVKKETSNETVTTTPAVDSAPKTQQTNTDIVAEKTTPNGPVVSEGSPAASTERSKQQMDKVNEAVAAAQKTVDESTVGHENAIFTPITTADGRPPMFVVRVVDQGKEMFYQASIQDQILPGFVERFDKKNQSTPILGRVDMVDGVPHLVSMYSAESYGNHPPDQLIKELTGNSSIKLEKLDPEQEPVLKQFAGEIFEGIGAAAAEALIRDLDKSKGSGLPEKSGESKSEEAAPATADKGLPDTNKSEIETSASQPKAAGNEADDINAQFLAASSPADETHSETTEPLPSLVPVPDAQAKLNDTEPFPDYGKKSEAPNKHAPGGRDER